MNSHGCRGCCLVSTAPSGPFLSFFLLSSLEEGQMGLFGGMCHCWVSILLQLLPSLSSLEPFRLTYLDASVQLNQVLLPFYHLSFSSKAKCFDATVFVTRGNNLVKSIISYHFIMYTNWALKKNTVALEEKMLERISNCSWIKGFLYKWDVSAKPSILTDCAGIKILWLAPTGFWKSPLNPPADKFAFARLLWCWKSPRGSVMFCCFLSVKTRREPSS